MPQNRLTHQAIQSHLETRSCVGDSVTVQGKVYSIIGESAVGCGIHSVVWKAEDEYGRERVIKLRSLKSYRSTTPTGEAYKAAKLESCEAFARFVDAEVVIFQIHDASYEIACFVEDYVDGSTLAEFLKKHSSHVSPSFMREYVRGLCVALRALADTGLSHDDLHPGNVLIASPSLGGLTQERRIQVVDTGNVRTASGSERDDHEFFVNHLVLIYNVLHSRRDITLRDRCFLREVRPLLSKMLDEDVSIALRDPGLIVGEFDGAYDRAMAPPRDTPGSLSSPFDFISADHIADDRLLVNIFAKSCPWLHKVSGPDACLVTGPRGCGKSTIFRWLSLKAHLHRDAPEMPEEIKIFGVYISCSADLQNRLGWIRDSESAAKYRKLIVHYFNLLAVREVVRTLELICRRQDRVSHWGFGETAEAAVYNFVVATVGQEARPAVRGVSRIEIALGTIEAELFSTQLAFQRSETEKLSTTQSFLGDLTALLAKEMPILDRLPVVFLVDDYSTHRISAPVQTVLNQVIWERRPSHVFKLSSEKHGAILNDELLATAEMTRERLEVDCGEEYLSLSDKGRLGASTTFARDLLNNRLRAAQYAGTAEQLIGKSGWRSGTLAKSLAARGANPRPNDYHGIECIAQLCSGDVSSLLLVFSQIFEKGNVKQSTANVVPAHVQDAAIVDVSRKMLNAIKAYMPHGPEMHKVASAFGNLMRRILQEATQKDGSPTTVPRIEIDEHDGDTMAGLKGESSSIAWELVRRAIFIEMESGLSRHRNVTTLRWNIRRIYMPAFRAALAKNDAVKQDLQWFEHFLVNPAEACERVFKDWGKLVDDRQLKLNMFVDDEGNGDV